MKVVKVSDVSLQLRGVSYKPTDVTLPNEPNSKPILRATNITANGLTFDDLVWVKETVVSEKQALKKDDIVIAASSGSRNIIGKASRLEHDWDGSFGAFCKVLRPLKNKIDQGYFYYFFQTDYYRKTVSNLAGGANINNLRNEHLDNFEIPLPPLPTQQKIAAILDKADSLRQKDKQLLRHYNQLAQSIFYDMFGDPVRNEKGWERVKIRDIVTDVKYGTSKPAEEHGEYPYLRMNNITYFGDWDFSGLKFINLEASEKDKYLLQPGDLVFNRTNSKELVGKTAVYDLDRVMAIAGYLIRVRMNERAISEYVSSFLNSQHGKAILKGMCKNIIGMANINAQELQEIELYLPPKELQDKFTLIKGAIKKQKQKLYQQIKHSETLFQSLLQKAFNGELVKE